MHLIVHFSSTFCWLICWARTPTIKSHSTCFMLGGNYELKFDKFEGPSLGDSITKCELPFLNLICHLHRKVAFASHPAMLILLLCSVNQSRIAALLLCFCLPLFNNRIRRYFPFKYSVFFLLTIKQVCLEEAWNISLIYKEG